MNESLIYSSAPTKALRFINPTLPWIGIWQRRDLVWQFTMREVAGRYKGLSFGVLWSFLNPLFMLAIYTFVFSYVMKAKWNIPGSESSGPQFALTLFCGLSMFNIFSECFVRAPGLVLGNPNYVKKVVFPLEILPVAVLGSALTHAMISFALLIVAVLIFMNTLSWTALLFPVMLLPLIFLSLGMGWFLSALGVFLRDIGYAINLLSQALVFVTPVFFPASAVGEKYRWLMDINPLSAVVENGRRVLLWQTMPDWIWLAKSLLFSVVFMQIGYMFFMKSKKAFADVL
jgi:lipopolysaccharide transport system permease protein